MPNIAAIHAAGVKAVQDYYGDDCPIFTWNGRDYKILPGSVVLRKDLGVGGFSLDSDLKFVVLTGEPNNFVEDYPVVKDTIEYSGKRYRIQILHRFPGETMFRYECNDASQSA